MIDILMYPDPRLKKIGRKVDDPLAPEVQKVIRMMFETLYNTANCAGLAATQLDFADPYAITVIDLSTDKNEPLCLINPEIIERSGKTFEEEGCMSVYPDHIHKAIKRSEFITVVAQNEKGETIEIKTDGFLAKCIQHEVDHLNGILYIDHLSSLKRQMLDKQIKKIQRLLVKNPTVPTQGL